MNNLLVHVHVLGVIVHGVFVHVHVHGVAVRGAMYTCTICTWSTCTCSTNIVYSSNI